MKDFKVRCVKERLFYTTFGKIYEVKNGRLIYDNGYKSCNVSSLEELNARLASQFELIPEPQQFTKDMLKTGMRVELRDGDKYIFVDSELKGFINGFKSLYLKQYNNDLIFEDNDYYTTVRPSYDIVKVFRAPTNYLIKMFDIAAKTVLLWQRPEPMKMTIAEAEAALTEVEGKPVVIVKE